MLPNLFQDVCPPGAGMNYVRAHSETAARYRIPEAWLDEMVTIVSTGSTLSVAFGDGGVMVGDAEVAAVVDTDTLVPNMASGFKVPAGAMVSFPVDKEKFTHFAVDSDGATGYWCIARSSGKPITDEPLPAIAGAPALWIDAAEFKKLEVASGDVGKVFCKVNSGLWFEESSNKPVLNNAAAAGADIMRPALGFTAGNSDKLVSTNAALLALLGGANAFTVYLAARRGATGAAHTLLSVGTTGSNNGRWDITLDASDDFVYTRVTSGGSSAASTYATSLTAAMRLYTLVFDGTTPTYYQDRTSQALAGGPATGNVGTLSKVSIGCRGHNTSTFDQFATAEIPDLLIFPGAHTAEQLAAMHNWLKRRHGK
jgi:hypothetical protein